MIVYDVLIGGGGISGAICGKLLADNGFRCAILEREGRPFEKICGGWIPYKAVRKMETIGCQIDWLITHGAVVTRAVVVDKKGESRWYPYRNDEYGLGVRRELLHRFLIAAAQEAGCDIYYSTPVTKIQYDGSLYRQGDFAGKQLIMAIGTGWTHDMNREELYIGQSFGISEWIRARTKLREDTVYFWYPQQILRCDEGVDSQSSKGYFWAIPIEKDLWNIGWWNTCHTEAGKHFQVSRETFINRHFWDVQTIRKPRGAFCGNINHVTTLPYPVLGVGDFAGCNNPDTGEGIYFAIQSAINLCTGLVQCGG